MPETVLITGVSTGIGAAAARAAAAAGAHVFGSVRRPEAASVLRAELGSKFTPLVFDVRDADAVGRAAHVVRAALGGKRLGGVVNNAGVALPGPLAVQPIAEFREQIEVNVIGPLIVTQAFLPLLGTDPALRGAVGRVVNVSSVAGKLGAPFLGGYAAAKHALEGMSESLRRELMLFGIDVVIVAPGAVATPIWDKAEAMPEEPYAATPYAAALRRFRDFALKSGRAGYPPEKVGAVIWTALTTERPALRYPVVINSFMNWTLPRMLPRRVVDRLIAKRVGLVRSVAW
jgi:NAD(P)-dependent dehydrogenase (short-subunit alcohol dehydrogenase family)